MSRLETFPTELIEKIYYRLPWPENIRFALLSGAIWVRDYRIALLKCLHVDMTRTRPGRQRLVDSTSMIAVSSRFGRS
jgi:hypothetical protein